MNSLITTVIAIKQFHLEWHIKYWGVKYKHCTLPPQNFIPTAVATQLDFNSGLQIKGSILPYRFLEPSSSLVNFF
jgi:hypothetical protein